MEALLMFLVALSSLSWVSFALVPWRPWSNQEFLDAVEGSDGDEVLSEITVVIPARNEAEVIQRSLQSVIEQGPGLRIILIDDGSEDATVKNARQTTNSNLRIIQSAPLPAGWGGKLWALEQGRQHVTTPYTLLLDADIRLARGIVKALREKMHLGKIADACVCVLLQGSLPVSAGKFRTDEGSGGCRWMHLYGEPAAG
jgi:cellulose synthase/poly-beta-1,6-N-acetylglucosamine synthase-like glycosyltransferase